MDSVAVTVPLRPPTKKMKKRKELDALAPSHVISRRTSGKRSSQELLTDSSDERSELWNVSLRGNRKNRTRRRRSCPGFLKACSAFFICASILATASLIWIFIGVRQQLTSLRSEIDQATANIKVVSTSFDDYQTRVNNLDTNQTNVYIKLNNFTAQISNLTIQLSNIQQGLLEVQQSIHDNPALNKAINLSDLISGIGQSRIKIHDLEVDVTGLKDSKLKLESTQSILQQNLTNIKNSLSQLSEIRKTPMSEVANDTRIKLEELSHTVSQVMINVSSINETLSAQFKGIQEDQTKDFHLLDNVRDLVNNATTKVMSLEQQCAKESAQKTMEAIINKLRIDVEEAHQTNVELNKKVEKLEADLNSLKKSKETSTDDDIETSLSNLTNPPNIIS